MARTNSVLSKVKTKSGGLKAKSLNPEELSLLRALIKFPEALQEASNAYSPNLLCNYLYNLAQKFNAFYNAHRILDSESPEFKIKLTEAVGITLKNGLNLLGIQAPERM